VSHIAAIVRAHCSLRVLWLERLRCYHELLERNLRQFHAGHRTGPRDRCNMRIAGKTSVQTQNARSRRQPVPEKIPKIR